MTQSRYISTWISLAAVPSWTGSVVQHILWFCFKSAASFYLRVHHHRCRSGSLFPSPRVGERAVRDDRIVKMSANTDDKETAGRRCVCDSGASVHPNEQISIHSRTIGRRTASRLHIYTHTHTQRLAVSETEKSHLTFGSLLRATESVGPP